jgi:SH3-like domain-containing protein
VDRQLAEQIPVVVSPNHGFEHVSIINCPFLGSLEDRETSFAYASQANHCHRTDTPVAIELAHQGAFCLSDRYPQCHVYRRAAAPVRQQELPTDLSMAQDDPEKRRISLYALPLVLVLLVLAAIIWWPEPGMSVREASVLGAPLQKELDGSGLSLVGELYPTPTGFVDLQVMPGGEQVEAVITESREVVGAPSAFVAGEGIAAVGEIAEIAAPPVLEAAEVAEAPEQVPASSLPVTSPEFIAAAPALTAEGVMDTDLGCIGDCSPDNAGGAVAAIDPAGFASILDAAAGDGTAIFVRLAPSAEADLLRLVTTREEVTILGRDESAEWLQVLFAEGLIGWVKTSASQSTVDVGGLPVIPVIEELPLETATVPVQTDLPVALSALVNVEALNVRLGPGLQYDPFAVVFNGQTVGLLGRFGQGPWVRIELADGAEGWVNAAMLAPVE